MRKFLKRGCAYMIDFLLVMGVSYMLSYSKINPQYEKVLSLSDDYSEVYTNYQDNRDKIEKDCDSSSTTECEEELKKLDEEVKTKYWDYSYELKKNSTVQLAISTVMIILYYVVFQYFNGGQTIGKKIMKLRVNKKDGTKVGIGNLFLRSLLLNGLLLSFIEYALLFVLGKGSFSGLSTVMYYISYTVNVLIIFFALVREDGRGLHDLFAGTIVEDLNPKSKEEVK